MLAPIPVAHGLHPREPFLKKQNSIQYVHSFCPKEIWTKICSKNHSAGSPLSSFLSEAGGKVHYSKSAYNKYFFRINLYLSRSTFQLFLISVSLTLVSICLRKVSLPASLSKNELKKVVLSVTLL